MQCAKCQHDNSREAIRCIHCDAPLGNDATVTSLPTHAGAATGWANPSLAARRSPSFGEFTPGTLLGERYEILQILGEGGMGAVYKARDREVDRLVAVKVIRPELANRPEILNRFKQELILARQITHKNVIRIFDLGVADGIRFITMEFVAGRDLSSLLEEQKLSPGEAVKILRQICAALEAAHAEGVIHRDLKPHNIMVEPGGRICVMDFGLARSAEAMGLTQTGAVMGTPAYMSPEQAKGETADARSDLFSLGIIAYQMLTGKVPFKADSILASMLLRTQGPPQPLVQLDPKIPETLNDIVLKALALNPADRYQNATALSQDLHDWEEGALARSIVTPQMRLMSKSTTGKWIALSTAVAMVVIAAVFVIGRMTSRPAAPHGPVTVMIADFSNHTGDPVFDGTLESTLKLALEGAGFISAYDRTRVRDLGLQPISGNLDEPAAQRIAVAQGLNVVVSGSLDRKGAGYELSLRAVQAVTGNAVANAGENASSKDQVLSVVTKLAATVRKALGDDTSDSAQRFAMETLSAGSLDAVHAYSIALDALSKGKNEEAQRAFSSAVGLDPNFGLAYAGMASASHNLGKQQDAEKYIQQAIKHIDRMTERERYRTRAFLYLLTGNQQKCVEEYGALLARYSSDTGAHNNVAVCLTKLRNMPKALEEVRRAVEILPNRATYRVNLALYSAYAGDFQTAEKEARAVLRLNPSYATGFVALAFANLGRDQTAPAAEAYQKLEKISASDAAAGLADLAMYEGRFGEAVKILQRGSADDVTARSPDAAADKFATLAYAELLLGQKSAALAAAESALANSKSVKTRFLAARVFVAAGEAVRARTLATELAAEPQTEPQVYAKLIDGESALQMRAAPQAIKLFTEANALLDTWIGHFDLGRAYLDANSFIEADSEFDGCIRRRGETAALFLDEVPTWGYFPPVYYFQGRVREGLKSAGFAESYRKYLGIRGEAGEDPLLAEVRRRAGK